MIIKNNKIIDSCSDTLPIGTLQPFLGTTAPQGYLFCEGQLLDKSKYPELYNICGNLFGESSTTQFYLPDLRGRVIAGYDENDTSFNTIGKLLGEKSHTLTVNEMPSHNHKIYGALTGENKGVTNSGNDWGVDTTRDWNKDALTNTGGGQAHNNIQPTLVLKWIVKAYALLPTDYFANGYDNMPVGSYIEYSGDNIPIGYEEDKNGLLERVQELERKFVYPLDFQEVQIGVWLGSKTYRMVYYIDSSKFSSSSISIDVTNLSIEELIHMEGWVESSTRHVIIPFYRNENSYISIYYDKINKKIQMGLGGNWETYQGFITLEYTKSEGV